MTEPATIPHAIDAKRAALADLCREFGVRRLELFGSATTGRFREKESDFDFLVTFANHDARGIARRFLGLAEGLERLLGRPVDLVTPDSIHNPYFHRAVDATRRLVYED